MCASAVMCGAMYSPSGNGVPTAFAAGSMTVTDGCASSSDPIYTTCHIYGNQEKVVRSYLYQSGDDRLTRVEFIPTSKKTVDYYDLNYGYVIAEDIDMKTGKLIKSRRLDMRLPLFGGFYVGEKYLYMVTGQENLDESGDREVFAVTRIAKDFKSQKSVVLMGHNTYIPFKAGSCRMTEAGGKLYIHTCHQVYMSDDNLRHQMNMSFVLDEESMEFEQKHYKVEWHYADAAFPYVSHSFDQFVVSDEEAVYSYDSGDAYPRALTLSKYDLSTKRRTDSELISIADQQSGDSYNYTGALTGGIVMSKDNLLIGVKMADPSLTTLDKYYDLKDIYVLVMPKSAVGTDTSPKLVNLTNYTNKAQKEGSTGRRNSAPKMVKVSDDRFLVMWKECTGSTNWWATSDSSGVTKIAVIDGSGKLIGSVMESSEITLSDCDPILCSDGKVRWYAASGSAPVLYAVDPDDPVTFGDEVIKGDADKNGTVDVSDVLLIQQHIAGWSVDIDLNAADVTGDAKADIDDALMIQQYIAGWDVTFK